MPGLFLSPSLACFPRGTYISTREPPPREAQASVTPAPVPLCPPPAASAEGVVGCWGLGSFMTGRTSCSRRLPIRPPRSRGARTDGAGPRGPRSVGPSPAVSTPPPPAPARIFCSEAVCVGFLNLVIRIVYGCMRSGWFYVGPSALSFPGRPGRGRANKFSCLPVPAAPSLACWRSPGLRGACLHQHGVLLAQHCPRGAVPLCHRAPPAICSL